MKSVITLEKPTPSLSLADWHASTWETQQTAQTRRDDAYTLRHTIKQLQNEANIRSQWDTYHNNARLADRITEIGRWRDTLESLLSRIDQEYSLLKDEKCETEREIDALGIFIGVISECLQIRNSRLNTELTFDEPDTELKKELCVLEDIKKMLTETCHNTWEKLNRLQEVRFKINLEISNKISAMDIDQDQLSLNKECANITSKVNALRTPKNCISMQEWNDHSRYMKLLADNELADTSKFREALFVNRQRAKNDMRSQRDGVDFALRKRIFETQKARNELVWQQTRMREEMEKLMKEIESLSRSFQDKIDAKKLAETRLENRYMRTGAENTRDEVELGLRDEVLQLRQTIKELEDKLNCAKSTYNGLEEQQLRLDQALGDKEHSMTTDLRCLDLRARMRPEEPSRGCQFDRNIELTGLDSELIKE